MNNDTFLVYRVNWLRAKSRRDRWAEEVELLRSELTWVKLYYDKQSEIWKKWAVATAQNQGNATYYALKQQNMWELFRSQAENALKLMTKVNKKEK